MRTARFIYSFCFLCMILTLTSCHRNSDQVWEDSKSAGRHMSRGLRTMGGKYGDSRAITSRDQFAAYDADYDGSYDPNVYNNNRNNSYAQADFVPLRDQPNDDQVAMADFVSQQPRETPGDPGSSIPGISAFQDPSTNNAWSGIFRNITFDYNSNLVKGQENLDTIHAVADYMKQHPNTYVFVEGHCDERGPEAYNLSLGVRRANAVRNLLMQEGVSNDNVFTISYGKERPLFHDQHEDAWSQNRRAEFKIYQR